MKPDSYPRLSAAEFALSTTDRLFRVLDVERCAATNFLAGSPDRRSDGHGVNTAVVE